MNDYRKVDPVMRQGQLRALDTQEVTDREEGPSGAIAGMLVILFVGLVCGYVIGLLTGQAMIEFLR